ncbi:unnamed protein product, partial [Brassica oleracea]
LTPREKRRNRAVLLCLPAIFLRGWSCSSPPLREGDSSSPLHFSLLFTWFLLSWVKVSSSVRRVRLRYFLRQFMLALWWLVPFAPSTQTFLRAMEASLAPSTSVLRGGWRFSLVPPTPLLLPGRGGSLSSLRRLLDYGERRLTQLLDADLEPIGLAEVTSFEFVSGGFGLR